MSNEFLIKIIPCFMAVIVLSLFIVAILLKGKDGIVTAAIISVILVALFVVFWNSQTYEIETPQLPAQNVKPPVL